MSADRDAVRLPTVARRRRRWALPVAAIVVAALVAGGWEWQRTAHSLQVVGYGVKGPAALGHTTYVGGLIAGSSKGKQVVDIWSIKPAVRENSSSASVSYWLCRGHGIGIVDDSYVATHCHPLSPFPSGKVDVGASSPYQVLAAIRPQRAGKVHIDGFDIRYRDGLRHGTVHSGPDLTFTTS